MSEGPEAFCSAGALAFQRRNWVAERIGWAVLGLLLAATGVGLFGSGPLSDVEVRSADGRIGVRYLRFLRREDAVPLRVRFRGTQGGMARVWLEARYLQGAQLEQVTPPPESVELAGGRVVYAFRSLEDTGEVEFRFRAEHPGVQSARFGVGEASVELRQLVYP